MKTQQRPSDSPGDIVVVEPVHAGEPGAGRPKRITTLQSKVPWTWVGWMMLPWMSIQYSELVSGAPLTFTLRKFVDQPALIAFLSSLNIAFNFMVGAFSSYLSDRVWTRWGRRRPFLLAGWLGAALMLVGIPLAPNLWTLAILIALYQFFQDVAKPYEPLYNEVVPPPQRGRAGVLRNISTSLTGLIFNGVLLAQFDREYGDAPGFALRGEHLVYWAGALMCLSSVIFLRFRVDEQRPATAPPIRRVRFGEFVRDVFADRRWWKIYILYACPLIGGAATYIFIPLMLTEQLGLTKAQLGRIESITMIANLAVFVPLSGLLADRFSRIRLLQVALAGAAVINTGMFLLVRFGGAETVSTSVILAVNVIAGAGGGFVALKYVLWGPLVYDYIPSDRYGTVSAGFSFVGGLLLFLMINLGGLWVQGFTAIFGTRGEGGFDYSSIFLFQLLASIGTVAFCRHFERAVGASGRTSPPGLQQ